MNGFRCSIIDGIETISRASSSGAVWSNLNACAKKCGFTHLLVLRARSDQTAVLFNDMPDGIAESFDVVSFWRDNPIVLEALSEPRPYSASELWAMPLTARLRRALATLSTGFGVRDGLIIPIRLQGILEGVVMVGGRAPEMGPIGRSALHVFAHSAFEQAVALENAPLHRPQAGILSPREIECLRWAAAGKTDAEIGELLKISARTARFHFENAKKKLGVSTRVQAVTEAMRLNELAA